MSLCHFVTRVKRIKYWEIYRDSSTLNVQVLTSVGEKLSQEEVFFSNIWYFSTTASYCPVHNHYYPTFLQRMFWMFKILSLFLLRQSQYLPILPLNPTPPSMIFSLSTSCHIWHLSYRILRILFFGGWTLWRGWSWWRRATQLWGFSIILIILISKTQESWGSDNDWAPIISWNFETMIFQVLCQVLE